MQHDSDGQEKKKPKSAALLWETYREPAPPPLSESGSASGPVRGRRTAVWASMAALVLAGGAGAAFGLSSSSGGHSGATGLAAQTLSTATSSTYPTSDPGVMATPWASSAVSATASASAWASLTEAPSRGSQSTSSAGTRVPVVDTTPPPQSDAITVRISGSVECQSLHVEGVWVQYLTGGGGWAPWISSAQTPGFATYSFTLPHAGQYALHVGCGGTTAKWAVSTYSAYYSGTVNDFYCFDERSSSQDTHCQKTP
jgi:hypothetical protein